MLLPTYEQAKDRIDPMSNAQKPSPLDWFIVENEPADIVGESKFRRELREVLDWVEDTAPRIEVASPDLRLVFWAWFFGVTVGATLISIFHP